MNALKLWSRIPNSRLIPNCPSIPKWSVILLAAMAGCAEPSHERPGRDPVTPPEDPQVVAVYNDGQVTWAEVDRAVLELPAAQRSQDTGQSAVEWHSGLIRELIVDRILTSEAELLGAGDDPETRATREEVRRQAIVEVFVVRNVPPQEELGEEEIRRFYQEHSERYDRPARRRVLHLFKRRSPGADLALLKEEVTDLRRRAMGGESFALLAAQHSESESRHREGQLGWLTRDQLAPELADVIFSLPEGHPSEPLPTAEGVHLFLVEQAVETRHFALDEVEFLIRGELMADRRQQALVRLADELPMPQESFMVEDEELTSLLAAGDPQATLLRVGDYELNAARFLILLAQSQQASNQPATPDLAIQLLAGLARRERIYRHAVTQGLADDSDVAELLARLERRALLRSLRQRAVMRQLSAEPEHLQEYYDHNRLRFSSSLTLDVRRLRVPIAGAEANRQMAQLEGLAATASSRAAPPPAPVLEMVAAELGGEIEELGWRTLVELARLDTRLAALASNLDAGDLSAPFRSESFLELLEVKGRREPEALPFATVLQQVRAAYLADHGPELYREWLAATLDEAELEIFNDRLEQRAGGETLDDGA